ncbi:MAG: formate hydrogenlyase [Acidimicrobiaceae bacterium]|nr:formate hydrogenlyase [Acidimicrobiaceae bacterium]
MSVAVVSPWIIGSGLLQVGLFLLGAPLLVGLMRTVRCRMEGRVGPPIRQPWRELRKLLLKSRSQPEHSTLVFAIAPVVLMATTLVVVWLTPLLSVRVTLSGGSDLFAIVFLLLLGSVSLSLAALDTGTAFGGMGSSRLMTIVALAEPALLVAILALAATVHSSSLATIMLAALHHPIWLVTPQRLLSFSAFVVVVLAESGRLPVDNPATHLELTMIHEALILEYSGPDLALIKLAESIRLTFLLALLANLFFPWGVSFSASGISLLIGTFVLLAKVAVLGVVISAGEVAVAKLRLFRVPELLAGAFMLSILAVLSALVIA